MDVNVSNEGGLCRIEVEGEMTIYTAAQLKESLIAPIEDCESMQISLAKISEIDASGLQLLALVKREAAAQRKPLEFVAHSLAVLEMLDLCNLAGVFGDPLVISAPHG